MPHHVITASRLSDGAVVWRDTAGAWRETIDRAATSGDDDEIAAMLAAARADEAAGQVVGPYEVEVDLIPRADATTVMPVRLRERIRACGPTVGQR